MIGGTLHKIQKKNTDTEQNVEKMNVKIDVSVTN